MKMFSAILMTVALLTVPAFAQENQSNNKLSGFAGAGALFNSESNPNAGSVVMGQVNLVNGFGIMADYTYNNYHTTYSVQIPGTPPVNQTRYRQNSSHSIHIGPAFRLLGNDSFSLWATVGIGARLGQYENVMASEFGGYVRKKVYKKVDFLFAPMTVTDDKITSLDLRCMLVYRF